MTRYHWVISLKAPTPRGYTDYGVNGTVNAGESATREELFQEIYDRARLQMVPVPDSAVVTFFSLERNDLQARWPA